MDLEIDAIGLLCPLPVLRARRTLAALPKGTRVRLLADDPAAVVDVPHFCTEAGHVLELQEEVEGVQVYIIRRG